MCHEIYLFINVCKVQIAQLFLGPFFPKQTINTAAFAEAALGAANLCLTEDA